MGGVRNAARWPWTWHRFLGHCRQVKSVYERAAMDSDPHSALPPRWMWFESDDLDSWFRERRESSETRKREFS